MPNIHAVSHSFAQLADLCATGLHRTPAASKPSWLKDLEATGWFEQLGYLLAAAERLVVGMGEKRVSCLVHCSDGWDRTTQLVSLAAMLLDPCVPSCSLLNLLPTSSLLEESCQKFLLINNLMLGCDAQVLPDDRWLRGAGGAGVGPDGPPVLRALRPPRLTRLPFRRASL